MMLSYDPRIGPFLLILGTSILLGILWKKLDPHGEYRWHHAGRLSYPWPKDPMKSLRFTLITLAFLFVAGAILILRMANGAPH